MRFIAFLYADPKYYAGLSAEEVQALSEEYSDFYNNFAGHIFLSESCIPGECARTLRPQGGEIKVTIGASISGEQELGGLYVIDCRDLDDAVAIMSKNPTAYYGSIEVMQGGGPLLKPADERY
jgi:hypothetical protein